MVMFYLQDHLKPLMRQACPPLLRHVLKALFI